jgi:PAS domain S-box-containing protein
MSDVPSDELKNTLSLLPDPIFMTDRDGYVCFLNTAGEALLGYTMNEALGLPLFRFFSPGEKEQIRDLIENIERDDPFPRMFTLQQKDGAEIDVSLTPVFLPKDEEKDDRCLFFARKTPPGILDERAVTFLVSALESFREGIFFFDLSGKILYTNPIVRGIFGYTEGEFLGKHISVLFALPDAKELPPKIIRWTTDGGWWEGEIINRKKDGGEFNARFKTTLLTDGTGKAVSIMGIIRDISYEVEMHRELVHTNRELRALYTVSTALPESIELDELLHISLHKVLEVMEMDIGVIRITEEESNDLVLKVYSGVSDDYAEKYPRLPIEGSVSGTVLKTGVPNLVTKEDTTEAEKIIIMKEGLSQAIIIPLRSKFKTLGTMSLGSYIPRVSSSQDIKLLTSIGNLIGMAVEHAMTFERAEILAEEKEIKVEELTLLSDLSRALLTTINMDKLLYIVLTAATMGESFGFNRAALLLVDEEEGAIVGRMGVGPLNAEEAHRIWRELEKQETSLFDLVENGFSLHSSTESVQNKAVRNVRIPLDKRDDAVVTSITENRPIIVTDARQNPAVDQHMVRLLMAEDEFAIVPIVAMEQPLGAILVDNIFNKKPIQKEDVFLLSAFANQAGLAIQNSILYRTQEHINRELRKAQAKLLQQAKLVGLGEMAAEIAHEIRNPLVSIGGFVRKIAQNIPDDKTLRRYSDIVIKETEKLENTLTNILSLPRDIPPQFTSVDLNRVIRDTVTLVRDDLERKSIVLETNLDETLEPIEADSDQLRQVFLNLFLNAIQVMEGGGTLSIVTSPEVIWDIPFVRIEIGDTGEGIPPEILGDIFTPFFTTKEAGTGLGLTITHKIIINHNGNIDVINKSGGGATFIVELPVTQRKEEPEALTQRKK